jgi:CRISPR-associated protein Csm5
MEVKQKIKLTILTPTHIGSGNIYKNNINYIISKKHLHLLDYKKIYNHKLLGEKFINDLYLCIENKKDIKFPESINFSEIAYRSIPCETSLTKDFHEYITSASYQPYIPGSSIKGFINTAILVDYLNTHKNENDKIDPKFYKYNEFNINLSNVFSKNFSRLIRCSDAYFPKNSTAISQSITFVLKEDESWEKRDNLTNLVETLLPQTSTTSFIHLFNEEKIKDYLLNEIDKNYFKNFYQTFSYTKLFKLLNKHTSHLINKEFEFLKRLDELFSEDYEDELKVINKQLESLIKNPNPTAAIIRIGKFTGFNTLTGHWQKDLMQHKDYSKLTQKFSENPKIQIYPKSRRTININQKSYPAGFIKLELIN